MLARARLVVRVLCVMTCAMAAIRSAEDAASTLTKPPILTVTVLADPDGWAQGLEYGVYNADPLHTIVLIVRKDTDEDVIVSLQDAEGFPIHRPLEPRPAIDPVDRKMLGYRYQLIAPRSSYVSYMPVPWEVVDRTVSTAGDTRIIPIPAATYTLTLTSAFRYATLAEGADSYSEDQAKPSTFVRVAEVFPKALIVKIDHQRRAPDFAACVLDALERAPGAR